MKLIVRCQYHEIQTLYFIFLDKMNEVIDVMALQRDKSRHATPIDYRAAEGKSLAPW